MCRFVEIFSFLFALCVCVCVLCVHLCVIEVDFG